MRRLITSLLGIVLAAALLPAAVSIPGCSILHPVQRTNDVDRLSDLQGDYDLALQIMLYAGQRGWLSRDVEEAFEIARAGADALLKQAGEDVRNGIPLDDSLSYPKLRDAVTKMLAYKNQYEPKVNEDQKAVRARRAATRPS